MIPTLQKHIWIQKTSIVEDSNTNEQRSWVQTPVPLGPPTPGNRANAMYNTLCKRSWTVLDGWHIDEMNELRGLFWCDPIGRPGKHMAHKQRPSLSPEGKEARPGKD